MGKEMKLKLFSDVYLAGCALAAVILFTIDCCTGHEVTLHVTGLIFGIPALAFCILRLYLDLRDYPASRRGDRSIEIRE